MLGTLTSAVAKFKRNLTCLDDQPLSKVALVIVIGLDLFILSSIFDGLSRHTAQLAQPNDYITSICSDIVITGSWSKANRMDRLAGIVVTHTTSPYRPADKYRDHHQLCVPILAELDTIKNDKALASGFTTIQRLNTQARDLHAQIERLKGPYDTTLLEAIAQQPAQDPSVDAVKAQINKKTAELNEVTVALAAAEVPLAQDERILRLWSLIDGQTDAEREQLRDDLRQLNFWYPVKRLGMELIFLLPLIAIFYWWNSASVRRSHGPQVLISSHLLVVTAIPVLIKLGVLVYDILPKKLLQHLIELLESLKLVALWNYLIIAFAIATALALIYLFQHKLFSRKKLLERRIAKGQCQECGSSLPAGVRNCPFCGFTQFTTCNHCQQPTYVYGRFCKECGQEQ